MLKVVMEVAMYVVGSLVALARLAELVPPSATADGPVCAVVA